MAGTLLAYSILWDSRAGKLFGSGLSGYGLDGHRRFHLFGDRPIPPLGVDTRGGLAYVDGALVDVRAGRIVRRVRAQVTLLLGDSPFWY